MISPSLTLPEGRAGQALAIALPVLAAALLWFALLAPLLGWYQDRAATLAAQQEIAAHMAALGAQIPTLRAEVKEAGLLSAGDQVLLPGSTDAIAGANLQASLQTLAASAGASLDSAEAMPAAAAGPLRRIGMNVSVTASWPVLIALLQAIDTARPRMVVDRLSIISSTPQQPLQVTFAVSGFRVAAP